MQDVFELRNWLIEEYGAFSRSFAKIAAPDVLRLVNEEFTSTVGIGLSH